MVSPTGPSEEEQQQRDAAPQELRSRSLGERVGARVRRMRRNAGISRRILSEKSGISSRYLAQLEAGEGNISVGFLQRLAEALDCKVEWFIVEEDPWETDSLNVLDLYRNASADVQSAVRNVLQSGQPSDRRAGRVCLIGLRGAGKSTLGAMLGDQLGLPFVELTNIIEGMAGMPLSEIMAFYGQEGYRRLEAQALDRVSADHQHLVLAVAGGIVAEPATFDALLSQFYTVWLRASPVEHMVRVRAQGDLRPMDGNSEAMDQLKSVLADRETQYSRASAQLDTSGQTPEDSLGDLHRLVIDQSYVRLG